MHDASDRSDCRRGFVRKNFLMRDKDGPRDSHRGQEMKWSEMQIVWKRSVSNEIKQFSYMRSEFGRALGDAASKSRGKDKIFNKIITRHNRTRNVGCSSRREPLLMIPISGASSPATAVGRLCAHAARPFRSKRTRKSPRDARERQKKKSKRGGRKKIENLERRRCFLSSRQCDIAQIALRHRLKA